MLGTRSLKAICCGVMVAFAGVSYAAKDLIDPEVEARVDGIMSKLTLEQKIAQMIQPEIQYVTPDQVRKYGFGSVLNGGGSFPNHPPGMGVEFQDAGAKELAWVQEEIERQINHSHIGTECKQSVCPPWPCC